MFDLSFSKQLATAQIQPQIPKSKSKPKVDSGESDNASDISEPTDSETDETEPTTSSTTTTSTNETSNRLKLKNKLAQLSPLKKRLTDDPMPKVRNKSISSLASAKNNPEDRASFIAKLMFPNLTHLDLSFNRLTRLSSDLSFLENLSYLNASSNSYLIRVSPKLGLLNKLWNFDLKNCVNLREPVMLDTLVGPIFFIFMVLNVLE
jgi:Leucine-rich repeat (LRR) protein